MADLFSEKTAENAEQTKSAESVFSDGTKGVCSGTAKSPRPLSQFILAKQYDAFSAGSESESRLTSSLFTSVPRLPETPEKHIPSPRRHLQPCRVEYPLYDGDLPEDPFFDSPEQAEVPEPIGISSQSIPVQAFPAELSVSAPFRSDSILQTDPLVPMVTPPLVPSISQSSVSDEEKRLPLPCDHFRSVLFPIFERYLAVCLRDSS